MLPDITNRLLAARNISNVNTGISKYGVQPGFDPATLGDQPRPAPAPTPIPPTGDVNPAYLPPVQVQPPIPFAANPIQRPLPPPAANPRAFGGASGDWQQNAQGNPLPGHWIAPSIPTPPGALGVQGQGGSFFTQSGSPSFDVPGGIPFDQSAQGQNAFNAQYGGRYHPITDFGAWRNPSVEWGGMTPQEFHDWSHSPQLSVAAMQALMANRPAVPIQREDQLPGLGIRHQGLVPRPM